jgi:hypothetical protein
LDTFPLLKDECTHSRKLYEHRISSWDGALQQILNNIPKLKQLLTNQKVSKQTAKKILLEECAKLGCIQLGVFREDDENIVSHRVSIKF